MAHRVGRIAVLLVTAALVGACADGPEEASQATEMGTPVSESAACWDVAAPAPTASTTPIDATEDATTDEAVPVGLEQVGTGFGHPVQVLPDTTGRNLVVELRGRIRTLEEPRELVLDLRGEVGTENEQGLLGAAVAPDGSRLWVHYTALGSGDTVVMEYPYEDGVAAGDGTEVLRLPQAAAAHNGGSLLIGPDGFLYLALGDAGVSENGQDPENPYGAILRFDACTPGELSPAPGNPAVGDDRVWHYGLRNPYRITFDAGSLYIADVGLSDVEEINVVPADRGGLNFGWPALEGTRCHYGPCDLDGAVAPVVELVHEEEDVCALIGGQVYRGDALPELDGHYLYGDFCAPTLWSVRVEAGEVVEHHRFDPGYEGRLLGFGQDAEGEVYLTTNAGRVYRLVRAD